MKISSLCVEIYFSLYFPRRPHPPSSSQRLTAKSKENEKQIEKRDCFEIHGASQVPTVPFGFPFMPSPSPSYVPLLFVKEITFFREILPETLVWALLLLLRRSIRILWVFCVGGEDKFAPGDGAERCSSVKREEKSSNFLANRFFKRLRKDFTMDLARAGVGDVEHRGVSIK